MIDYSKWDSLTYSSPEGSDTETHGECSPADRMWKEGQRQLANTDSLDEGACAILRKEIKEKVEGSKLASTRSAHLPGAEYLALLDAAQTFAPMEPGESGLKGSGSYDMVGQEDVWPATAVLAGVQ
eukprot:scaffold188_cov429-Prasinococcus_capsulatus_cf.AAC.5